MKEIRYINAGAGSGKTHKLSHILSDNLQTATVSSSQIILTTFTKAAAAEFREKARSVLIGAGRPDIAAELEGAAIGTVHSVCEQFIHKYWYSLGLSPKAKVISDEDKDFYINQSIVKLTTVDDIAAFNDFCRNFNVTKFVDGSSSLNFEFWKDDVKKVIDKMTTYNISDLSGSLAKSLDEISNVFNGPAIDTAAICDFLDKLEKAVGTYNAIKPSDTNTNRLNDIKECKKNPGLLSSLFKIYDFFTAEHELNVPQRIIDIFNEQFPHFDKEKFIQNVEGWLRSADFKEAVTDITKKILRIAGAWRAQYAKFKADNQILDFNDLEQYFLELLKNPAYISIRDEIKNNYRLLMVDEFQDSNPVQLEIFDHLSDLIADGGGETFWVGDPKQSIYGFRGSDTKLIQEKTSAFLNERDHPTASLRRLQPLDTSWRSRPELVSIANNVFRQAFEGQLSVEDIILPNQARPKNELSRNCLHHWSSCKSSEHDLAQKIYDILYSNRWDIIRKKRDDETQEEYDLTKINKIEPKDVAVLCRKREDVKKVVSAFRDAGIPVSSTEPDIIDWAEIQLVLALLRYVVDKNDIGARADIMHLLREMPTEEILDQRYNYLAEPGKFDEWFSDKELFEILDKISARIGGMSVSDILSQLILELGLYEYAQKWDYADARRQNLGLIQRLATQYEEHCLQLCLSSSVVGFVDYISHLEEEVKNEDNSSDTVKVMTYHKAKGLEWNLVVLCNLANKVDDESEIARRTFMRVSTSIDATVGRYINYFPYVVGSKKSLPEPFLQRISDGTLFQELKADHIDEERRLLYVGFTRARDFLVTFGKNDDNLAWVSACNAGPGTSTANNDNNASIWFEALSKCEDISGYQAQNAQTDTPAGTSTWAIKKEIDILPKYINPSTAIVSVSSVALSEIFSGWTMVTHIIDEAECGTCIHNIFAAYNPAVGHMDNVAMAQRLVDGKGLSSQLPDAESIIVSIEQFVKFLNDKYPGCGKMLKEVPFLLQLDETQSTALGFTKGQIVRGEIDLVWMIDEATKTCVLVDYKSYNGNPNINSSDPNVQKHYQGYTPQLAAYKTALESSGYKVEAVLIYYHVQGRAIRFEI